VLHLLVAKTPVSSSKLTGKGTIQPFTVACLTQGTWMWFSGLKWFFGGLVVLGVFWFEGLAG
jgi:hypothetical protein